MKIFVFEDIPQVECSGLTVATVSPLIVDFIEDFVREEVEEIEYISIEINSESEHRMIEETLKKAGYENLKIETTDKIIKIKYNEKTIAEIWNYDSVSEVSIKNLSNEELIKIARILYNETGNVLLHVIYKEVGDGCGTYLMMDNGIIEISTMDWWPEHAEKLKETVKKLGKKYELRTTIYI